MDEKTTRDAMNETPRSQEEEARKR